jgi:hypothetical protein
MASNGFVREGSNGNGAGADLVRSALENKDFYVPVAVGLAGAVVAVTGPSVARGVASVVKDLEFEPSGIIEKMSSSLGFEKGSSQSGSGSSGRRSGQTRRSSSPSRASGKGSGGQKKRSSAGRSSAKRSRSSSGRSSSAGSRSS